MSSKKVEEAEGDERKAVGVKPDGSAALQFHREMHRDRQRGAFGELVEAADRPSGASVAEPGLRVRRAEAGRGVRGRRG